MDEDTVNYFKAMAAGAEIPYQTLITLYLRDCAQTGRRIQLEWHEAAKG